MIIMMITIIKILIIFQISIHEQDKNVSGYLWVFKKKKMKKRWFVLKDHVLYAYKAPSVIIYVFLFSIFNCCMVGKYCGPQH